MDCSYIEARDLDEAHCSTVREVFARGRVYTIDRGSFVGHRRLELPFVTLRIIYPGTRPLSPQLPSGVPSPTDEDAIIQYFSDYLYSDQMHENEIYTYGQYIVPQIQPVADMLIKDGPGTNQATMTIGDSHSIHQEHPPCLRIIDWRVMGERLHMVVYFRSWDCWAGLPENLGGLQLLKEYMAAKVGIEDGEIVATSKGLHLYDYQWPIAFARLNQVVPEGCYLSEQEILAGENNEK